MNRALALLDGPLSSYLEHRGYLVECRREHAALRVFPLAPGYRADWHCAFPRALRRAGLRYAVERLREVRRGYYCASGRIWHLAEGKAGAELTALAPEEACTYLDQAQGGPQQLVLELSTKKRRRQFAERKGTS